MATNKAVNRYSQEDLDFFKQHILQKLEKAKTDQQLLLKQIENSSDSKRNDGDWMDDTSNNADLELLDTMISRSRRHIQDLENALLRIYHKNYGICVVTGELIDKRRLLAVPTTTKSLLAKSNTSISTSLKTTKKKPLRNQDNQQIISKIIQKPDSSIKLTASLPEEYADDDLFFNQFEDYENDMMEDMDLNDFPMH